MDLKSYKVFISAAEPSADGHCAGLINAMRQADSNVEIEFTGVGGPKMAAAGCRLLAETAGKAVMSYNAVAHAGSFFLLIQRIKKFIRDNKPDLVIVCDSPAFNFHVAKAAKTYGVKTLFYVAPQLWAWGAWRLEKLRKCCDKLCCLLPFEQEWFSSRGIDSQFVGNPLLDELNEDLGIYLKDFKNYQPSNAKVLLLAGSRTTEINTLWRPMQQTAVELRKRFGQIEFTAVTLDAGKVETLKSMQVLGFKCRYTTEPLCEAAQKADLALVASGSATLQLAGTGCPMVVMYQSNKLLWHTIGKRLIKSRYLSLTNILAGRELVPEFMPYFNSIVPVANAAEELLADADKLRSLRADLITLSLPLRQGNAAINTAHTALKMLKCD